MWDGEQFNLLADLGDDNQILRLAGDDDGNIYAIGGVHDNSSSITANWKSKRLDFADKFPQYKDWWKSIDLIQLKYKDQYENTPVTIYISNDGVTWDSVTVDEQPATLAAVDGWLRFSPETPGEYVITATAPVHLVYRDAVVAQVRVPRSVQTRAVFEAAGLWEAFVTGDGRRIVPV